MAIQFRCPHCGKAIEVDDEHAGGEALCPFCDQTVRVPPESTLRVEPARPVGEVPPVPGASSGPGAAATPELPELPSAETVARQMAARSFARYALISAVLCYLLFGAVMVYSFSVAVQGIMELASGPAPPTTQQQAEIRRSMFEKLQQTPWVAAANLGSLFFALVGVLLAIVSLRQQRSGNWMAVLSLVGCGLYMTCTCGSIFFAAAFAQI